MRIDNHSISFSSSHRSSQSYFRQEKLEYWTGENPHRQEESSNGEEANTYASPLIKPDRVVTETELLNPSNLEKEQGEKLSQDELELKILIESVNVFMDETNISFRDPDSEKIKQAYESGQKEIKEIKQKAESEDQASPQNQQANFGLRYDSYERYEEKESLEFEAKGEVRTANGKSIDFSVSMNMNRQFTLENEEHIRAGNAQPIDPLVINYSGEAAELSDQNFDFDLDLDGTLESLPVPDRGSGFLALDKNGNGKIDDGSELFGPSTGNGFDELASYDRDGNRFIDEGDSIYEKLYVFSPGQGKDNLQSLEDIGAGAIFLGSSDTSFSFKKQLNLQGQLKRSGVYLKENGQAGLVQEIDLAPQNANFQDGTNNKISVSA